MSHTDDFERLLAIEGRVPAMKQLVESLSRVCLDTKARAGLDALQATIRDLEAWDAPTSPDLRCRCTYEAGDSECPVHPSCPGCGSLNTIDENTTFCADCGRRDIP